MKTMQVAIDGTAGSGKSFIGKELAKLLNYKFLSTGKIYRAIAYKFLETGLNVEDEKDVLDFLNTTSVEVCFNNNMGQVLIDGNVVVDEVLESEQVGLFTSIIAQKPVVRQAVVSVQRDVGDRYDVVMEGRDIASVVLPNADVKFYITAPDEIRYNRILKREEQSGQKVDIQQVKRSTELRDKSDKNRKTSPLVKDKNAILITNAGTVEAVGFLVHAMSCVVKNKEEQNKTYSEIKHKFETKQKVM